MRFTRFGNIRQMEGCDRSNLSFFWELFSQQSAAAWSPITSLIHRQPSPNPKWQPRRLPSFPGNSRANKYGVIKSRMRSDARNDQLLLKLFENASSFLFW